MGKGRKSYGKQHDQKQSKQGNKQGQKHNTPSNPNNTIIPTYATVDLSNQYNVFSDQNNDHDGSPSVSSSDSPSDSPDATPDGEDGQTRQRFEVAACSAMAIYLQQRQIGDVHPAISETYRFPLTERTRSIWRLPRVMSPFTGVEATHVEVSLSVEHEGAVWEAQVSWIMPSVPEYTPECSGECSSTCIMEDVTRDRTIRLTWIVVNCEVDGVATCTTLAEHWRGEALHYFAGFALYAAGMCLLSLPAPVHTILPSRIKAPSDPSAA